MKIQKKNIKVSNNFSIKKVRDGYIFISYKREDAEVAEKVYLFLKNENYSVWWDRQIQCGQQWSKVLDDAVKGANCILVLWSSLSTDSKWVLHEASIALTRENYAPARISLCSIPPPYDQLQATDIFDWNGNKNDPGIQRLMARCGELLPERKSALTRLSRAAWSKRMTVLSVLFAIIAITILGWQSLASQSQLDKLKSLQEQQESSSKGLNSFQEESKHSVQSQLTRLDSVSRALNQFRTQAEDGVKSQFERLNTLIDQQEKSNVNLNNFRQQSGKDLSKFSRQIDLSISRGYYPLDTFTIEFTLEYSFSDDKLLHYVNRLRQSEKLPKFGSDYGINLMHPDFTGLLPGKDLNEKYANEQLLSDNTSFTFTDLKQMVDSNSRSFVRKYEQDRGIIRFSSMPQYLADVIVKLPSKNKVEQKIELAVYDNKFIKTVRCQNPVRTGDDVYAFSIIDLIGRVMKYEVSEGDAILKEFRFKFSFDYDSYSYLNSTIFFADSLREMVLTPQHLGLNKYEVDESVLLAREQFAGLPIAQKIKLLNSEVKNRLDYFIKTFVRMENDNTWNLAEWAKIEWTADALDGNPPFIETNIEDKFKGRSFKWLLKELLQVTSGNDKKKIETAIKGTNNLFILLTSAKPDSRHEEFNQIVNQVKQKIFNEFGLKLWHSGIEF